MSRNVRKFVWLTVAASVVVVAFMLVTLMAALAPRAQAQATPGQSTTDTSQTTDTQSTTGFPHEAYGMAFLSASIVMCVSCVAAGVAVGMTGSAAIGAVAERPELMGRTVLIVGLAEGIAIYGLIIAIMILGKIPAA